MLLVILLQKFLSRCIGVNATGDAGVCVPGNVSSAGVKHLICPHQSLLVSAVAC